MRKNILPLIWLFLIPVSLNATTYYVATDGSDSNAGTKDKPFATLNAAQNKVVAGDTLYFRGGTYSIRESQIMGYEVNDLYACVFDLSKSGTATKPICYFGYPGERPVFDLSKVKPANKRISVFYLNGSYLHFKNFEIIGTQVTITTHTQSECFSGRNGSSNIIENVAMHNGMAIGVYIVKGSNYLVLNCDAYNNYDTVSEGGKGGNVDGFGCHVAAQYTGNVFRGCRSWCNSDDCFDLINNYAPVTFDNCWSFYNGYQNYTTLTPGDGNGFKAGGYGSKVQAGIVEAPRNTVENCIAYHNKANGFYANHHLGGNNWYNNSAYLNKYNYDMVNQLSWDNDSDVDGYGHVLVNNISFNGSKGDYLYISTAKCTLLNNSFLPTSYNVSASDFESTDYTQLAASRQADGSLPEITFLKLKPTSEFYSAKMGYQFHYGEVTGINDVVIPTFSRTTVYDNKYYNLMGIQIDRPGKGVFIFNGKKIMK